jgi:hypothetical protein
MLRGPVAAFIVVAVLRMVSTSKVMGVVVLEQRESMAGLTVLEKVRGCHHQFCFKSTKCVHSGQ